jgi:hypothetical protein
MLTKDHLSRIDKAMLDPEARSSAFAIADRFKQYHGKVLLGKSFAVTRSSLAAVAVLCGETAVVKFFDGEDLTAHGRKVSEWLADCEKVEVK